MNQKIKYIMLGFCILVILSFTMQIIVDSIYRKHFSTVELIPKVIEIASKDKLLDSIGKYHSSVESNELSEDSITFTVRIFGEKKTLIYSGKAGKSPEGEWEIKDDNPADFIFE